MDAQHQRRISSKQILLSVILLLGCVACLVLILPPQGV